MTDRLFLSLLVERKLKKIQKMNLSVKSTLTREVGPEQFSDDGTVEDWWEGKQT